MPLPDEYLGVSPDAFEEYMNDFNFDNPPHTYPLRWMGADEDIPVFRIDIKKPRYNHRNGRIKPHVYQYCGEQGFARNYFDEEDPSTIENQRLFDNFISNDTQREECYASFSEGMIPMYTEPLISTRDGRIINGNQRLSTFRELHSGNDVDFDHLSHVWVAFLPERGQESDYRRLERKLQEGGVLGDVKFDWIQTGLNRRDDLEDGDSVESIARWAGETEDEVTKSIDLIHIVDSYLAFLGVPGHYNTFRSQNHRQSILEMSSGIKKISNIRGTDNDLLITEFCDRSFKLMETPSMVDGSGIGVYGHIRYVVDLLVAEAANVRPRQPRRVANRRLNRRRNDEPREEEEEEEEENPVLDLEPEGDEENLAESIRNAHGLMRGRQQAANQNAYANRQLTGMITSLNNIIEGWGNHELEGVPEKIEEVEGLLARIRERLGEGE